jgi:aminopeptidase-like protein
MALNRTAALSLALLLAGCAIQPLGSRLGSDTRSGVSSSSARAVDTARMRHTMAHLTGHEALPNGKTIPERGSAEGRAMARDYLEKALSDLGLEVERHRYRSTGENLIARLPASEKTDQWVLIGAHFDSVRNAGANDNASGTAIVLEAARLLKSLEGRKVNLMVAFFDEEELGLVGSAYMAREFKRQKLNLTSVHTVDMLAWDSDKDRAIEVEMPDGNLEAQYRTANKTHGLNLTLYRTSTTATDHTSFRREGFHAVGLTEEYVYGDTTPHYHKKSDAFNTLNIDYMATGTQLLVAAVGDLLQGKVAPAGRQMPHDAFPGRVRHQHPAHE